MYYIFAILLADVAITLCNLPTLDERSAGAILLLAGRVLLATVAVIAVDGIGAFLIRRLPEKLFAPGRAAFRVGEGERRVYRRLGVKAWKDYVPELGGFSGFHKNRLASTDDGAYLARFLLESNYGVVIHLFNALTGPLILLLPWCSAPSVWIPVAAVNFLLSLLPAVILRYHTPPLLRLYRRSLKRAEQ